MALFASLAAAEVRLRAKIEDGTFVTGHVARDKNGKIIIRVQRFMSPTARAEGGWIELDDDTQT